jgi:hypothetical protein
VTVADQNTISAAVHSQSSESGLIRVPFEGPPTRMTPLVTAVLMAVWCGEWVKSGEE